jgi:multidrug resistance efflux pump
MKTPMILAAALAALPMAAGAAEISRSQAVITGPVAIPTEPAYVLPGAPEVCSDIEQRKAVLDDEKVTYDHERDQLDAEAARLAREYDNLDRTDTVAVAAYNARSDEHNRQVAAHNARVADMNYAVAQLTADIANATPACRYAWNY